MKKLTLITLLLVPFLGISQTTKPIDGFLGIKFGTSKAATIAALKAKGGVLDGKPGSDCMFTGINLGRRTSAGLMVSFFNNKVYEAAFFFKPDNDPEAIDYYNSLVSDISGVYGAGTPTKTFKSPYEDGDGHESTALEMGYASFFTNWKSNNNLIQALIRPVGDDKDLYVLLYYTDKTIEKAAKQATNQSAF